MVAMCAVLLGATMSAKLNLPTRTLGTERFYYYEVGKNETIHDVATKIGVSKEDIIKFNPSARNGLVKKQLIFLPVSEFDAKGNATTPRKVNVNTLNNSTLHVVKSGESVYGIAKAYNITESELLNANPSLAGGLKTGEQLLIPTKPAAVTSDGIIYHTVKSGETLYGVARDYNTTIEKLMELNPGISGNNFRADDVIKVLPNTSKDIIINKPIKQFIPYVVGNGDTYESVAAANGVSVKALRDANPDHKKLKKGKTIYIPKNATDKQVVSTSTLTAQQLEETYKDKLDEVYDDIHSPHKNNSIDISIVLPFQLGEKNRSRNSKNYEEFYNGFLLALDSVGNKLTKPLNLNVYDTKQSLVTTDSILRLDVIKNSDIIIAPSEIDQLQKILRFGKANDIDVLNCFATQNDDYINNIRAMQVNIPSPYMNAKVNEYIDTKFKDYVLVFLDDPTEQSKDIYDDIKSHAEATHHQRKSLTIASDLTGKSLSRYLEPGSNYLFIPANGKESFLNKFATGIKEAKDMRVDCELVLLGHPEYTMYIKKHRDELMDIDTYIYSRFYMPSGQAVDNINAKYVKTFGSKATNSTPNMSIFGFDTGMFLVNAFSHDIDPGSKESAYKGIQTNFNFERANNWAGFINKSVRIIHLTPSKELKISDLND